MIKSPCCGAEVRTDKKLESDGSTCNGCECCGQCWFERDGMVTDSVREVPDADGFSQNPTSYAPIYDEEKQAN